MAEVRRFGTIIPGKGLACEMGYISEAGRQIGRQATQFLQSLVLYNIMRLSQPLYV